jgi:hypothetical protein
MEATSDGNLAMTDDSVEELMVGIARLLLHVPQLGGVARRLRIAVSPAEMYAIDLYCFKHTGKSWRRLRDVELIVVENPLSEERSFATAPLGLENRLA